LAQKSNGPPPIEIKKFTIGEIDAGIRKLRRRIEDLNGLEQDKVRFDDARVKNVESNIKETIREIFGTNSPEFRENEYHDIWSGGRNLGDTEYTIQSKFSKGIPQSITILEGLIARLEEKRADIAHESSESIPTSHMTILNNQRVFVVHGHDEEAKLSVARFLEQLKLESVILSERPNEGRTIIEKFEHHSDVSYAVVILTPDDMGYEYEAPNNPRPRARQNVILELGYFIGRLGRSHVCALHKGSVEIPTDYHGVLYVPLDAGEGWKLKLAKEMKEVGLEVDLNLVL